MRVAPILSVLVFLLSTQLWSAGAAETHPVVTAVRTELPPTIDGVIDAKEWEKAATIEQLTQIIPVEGTEPTEKTIVRVQYDSDNLYLAIQCLDSEASLISASQMQNDSDLSSDDIVEIAIDPFADKRNGYYFAVSAGGSKTDGIVDSREGLNTLWDAVWHGKTRINADGWSVEIAIPFKSISFNEGASEWGLNISRLVRRKQETIRWSGKTVNQGFLDFRQAGTLAGLSNLKQGIGLTVEPYGAITASLRDGETEFRPGINMAYKLTPSTTAQLTVNTDFAEAEVDQQVVNLSRFPVFFPEKRAFFLQDVSIFSFGGIQQSPIPFYSRRIGIVLGEKKNIFAGIKVTGREGILDFGVLDVQMYDDPELGPKNLAAARVSADISEQSTAGLIVTHGDPGTTGSNTVLGGDFSYRNSHVFGDNVLQANAWTMGSFSTKGPLVPNVRSGIDEDDFAIGGRIRYPNDKLSFSLYGGRYGTFFRPALGFIQRPGKWEFLGHVQYRWRTEGYLRTITYFWDTVAFWNLNGSLQTLAMPLINLNLENNSGDSLYAAYTYKKEILDDNFSIVDSISLPPGVYDFHVFSTFLETSAKRVVSGFIGLNTGRYFNGFSVQPEVALNWRPSKHFLLGGYYQYIYFDLNGKAHIHIASANASVLFTPALSWITKLQYDTESKNANVNSVLRYEISPGQKAFLVVNQDVGISDGFVLIAGRGQISMKLGMTLTF